MRCFKCGKTIDSKRCSSCGLELSNQIQLIWNLNRKELRDLKSILLTENALNNCQKRDTPIDDSSTNESRENLVNNQQNAKSKSNQSVTSNQTQNNVKSSEPLTISEKIYSFIFFAILIILMVFGSRIYNDIKFIVADYDETTNKIGFISSEFGRVKIPYEYEDIAVVNEEVDDFSDKICWLKKDGLWGAINKKNKIVVPFKYYCKDTLKFDSKVEPVELLSEAENKHGKITYNGEIIIPFEYDTGFYFNENNITLAVKDGKVGAINAENGIVIPFEYEFLYDSGSYLRVYPYDYIFDFEEFGMAILKKNNKIGVINAQNEVLIPFEYDFEALLEGYFSDDDGGMYQFYHHKYLNSGVIILLKDGKFGAININNEIVVPFEYDRLSNDGKYISGRKDKQWYEFDLKGNRYDSESEN